MLRVGFGAIGAVGYHSDLRIVDPHGIVDPVIAHQRRELGRGTPGHEKFDAEDLLARRPDYLLIYNLPAKRLLPERRLRAKVWGELSAKLEPRLCTPQMVNPSHDRSDRPLPGKFRKPEHSTRVYAQYRYCSAY